MGDTFNRSSPSAFMELVLGDIPAYESSPIRGAMAEDHVMILTEGKLPPPEDVRTFTLAGQEESQKAKSQQRKGRLFILSQYPTYRMLPPEQFHIKRRREEEPVETLYIQSELHQTKRRFTDFVFQRVKVDSHTGDSVATRDGAGRDASSSSSTSSPYPPSPAPAAASLRNSLRSPRSVSTTGLPCGNKQRQVAAPVGGIPTVRATSPGAEFRDERLRAESQRQEDESKRKRLQEPISLFMREPEIETKVKNRAHGVPDSPVSEKDGDVGHSRRPLSASPSAFPTSFRRFRIARPSTSMDSLKGGTGSGMIKKGTPPSRARAVLVEKLTRAPSLRGASALQTLEKTADGHVALDTVAQYQAAADPQIQETVSAGRKRPVVNKAEKQWKEQQKIAASAAKENLTTKYKSDGLDKLAEELEQVMLDIESEEKPHFPPTTTASVPAAAPPAMRQTWKPPLKFQPRNASVRTTATTTTTTTTTTAAKAAEMPVVTSEQHESDRIMREADDDGDYVYDTYIRIPLHTASKTPLLPEKPRQSNITGYTDPLVDANAVNGVIAGHHHLAQQTIDPTRTDIGIVVITSDDEELWDQYLEEDRDSDVDWDGEDVDSNAEDNPANDYPDEELSSADEYDEQPSIYRRYRSAASDDEEFDTNEFDADDVDADYRKYMYDYVGDDDDDDDDDYE